MNNDEPKLRSDFYLPFSFLLSMATSQQRNDVSGGTQRATPASEIELGRKQTLTAPRHIRGDREAVGNN